MCVCVCVCVCVNEIITKYGKVYKLHSDTSYLFYQVSYREESLVNEYTSTIFIMALSRVGWL